MPFSKKVHRRIYVVSDSTGRTAETVTQAALSQFSTTKADIEVVSNVRSEDQVREVVERAAQHDGVIMYTIVVPEFRQQMTDMGRQLGVPTIDVLGPVLTRLSDVLEISPMAVPGLLRQLDSDYFRRIDAIDYSVKHDDGAGADTLDKAELVILGVSRTTKTPLSWYLAYRGWRVANIPIVLGLPLPKQIHEIDGKRIIGLTMTAARMRTVRLAREAKLGGEAASYADIEQVRREILYADRLYATYSWKSVDVTHKSIEETATEVMRIAYAQTGVSKGYISQGGGPANSD